MLDLVSIDNTCKEERQRSISRLQGLVRAYQEEGKVGEERRRRDKWQYRMPVKEYLVERSKRRAKRAGWLTQLGLLIKRQWRQTSR